MWEKTTFFVISGFILLGIFNPFIVSINELKILIQDEQTSELLPFTTVTICGKSYVADGSGELIINDFADKCIIKIQRLGYSTFEDEIFLKGKNTLVIQLKMEDIFLDEFVVMAERINTIKVDDIIELTLRNFKNNHLLDNLIGKVEERMSFQFGYEPIFERLSRVSFEILESEFLTNPYNDYTYKILNSEKYEYLEGFLKESDPVIRQLIDERGNRRSDNIIDRTCNPSSNMKCYSETFFPIERNYLFNPLFNHKKATLELDHFGFFNQTFLSTHKFKLIGQSKLHNRDCFVVKILNSPKSIPVSVGGHPVKNLYVPDGLIFIDVLTFAILKLEYKYRIIEKRFKSQAYKNELNSGEIFFENVIIFKNENGKWLPSTQFVKEKDRALKIFNSFGGFESGYLSRNLTYFYE